MSNYPDGCNIDHPAIAGHPEPEEVGYAVYCADSDEWWGHPIHNGSEQAIETMVDAQEKAGLMAAWASGQYEEGDIETSIYMILDHGESATDRYELQLNQTVSFELETMKLYYGDPQ